MERKRDKSNIFSGFESEGDESFSAESGPEDTQKGQDSQEAEASSSEGDLKKTAEECQALEEKYLRLAAEFENYKRLAQRDQREFHRFANEQLLKDLLPVIDNLERAIQSATKSSEKETIIQGIELTLKQFLELLGKAGVRQMSSIGEVFDPSRHQAVARLDGKDVPENTVTEEYQKGYLLHERVLRPAMVGVASGQGSSEKPRASS
ncbi:MAG: nucleotide exchange factor GrpE [Actinobacteria bacterium]|nr:nucleotide exchange factor GrpE [Actinomycetota bacterium]